jgi:hypothetical protein
MYYEERHQGVRRRLDLEADMLTGRAHHCEWAGCPNFALKSMALCVVHANWNSIQAPAN